MPDDILLKWAKHLGAKDADTGQFLIDVQCASHASLHYGTTVLGGKRIGRRETDSSSSDCFAFVPYELGDQPAEVNVLEVNGIASLKGDLAVIEQQIVLDEAEMDNIPDEPGAPSKNSCTVSPCPS